jgi:hypothetical protein
MRKKLFPCRHSPSSSVPIFHIVGMSLVSTLESGLRGLFARSLVWFFFLVSMGYLVLVLEDGGLYLVFFAGVFCCFFCPLILGFLTSIA